MTTMNLLVTGGTGVLGRPTLRRLLDAGHTVRATVRSDASAGVVRSLGAEPVEADLFDPSSVKQAVSGADGVLHLATSIPPISKMARRSAWRLNDRLRGEATMHLASAARDAGVELLLAESVTFMYPDRGDEWIDETLRWPPPNEQWESTYQLEGIVNDFAGSAGRGIVLRFGLFYGPEARSVDEALRLARVRASTVAGRADAYVSSIHSDDASSAVVASLGAPSGKYNVVDDEPVTRRDYLDSFSAAFGLRRLRPVPARALKLAGGGAADILVRSQRVSNEKMRRATDWAPDFPSVREGWPAIASEREEVAQ